MRNDAFFVDIESNFGANPAHLTHHQIAEYCHQFSTSLAPDRSDLVVVACNPAIRDAVRDGWYGHARIVTGPGRNGADQALIAAATIARMRPVHTVWLCAADSDLLPVAERATALGKRLILTCGHRQPSRRLQLIAHRIAHLDIDMPRKAA